jgi:selenide,water dikinase
LGYVISQLPSVIDTDLLVGTDTVDDAAVLRVSDEIAMVQTVDFFTPVVDDPYDFGRIAAANSMSDIYAMGATPRLALNIVGFPLDILPLDVLVQILKGGADVAREAGVTIGGGHTIDDREPKYGMVVTGFLRPGDQVTNASAAAGDFIVLTKPLGTGIVATAIKKGVAGADVVAAATASMATLNREGSRIALAHGVRAMTDVTGFGLLGHLSEMCAGGGLSAEIWSARLPLLPGAVDLVMAGIVPGGTRRNLEHVESRTRWADDYEDWERLLHADAQTSGGLLLAIPADELDATLRDLELAGTPAAALIGRFVPEGESLITVRREAAPGVAA